MALATAEGRAVSRATKISGSKDSVPCNLKHAATIQSLIEITGLKVFEVVVCKKDSESYYIQVYILF